MIEKSFFTILFLAASLAFYAQEAPEIAMRADRLTSSTNIATTSSLAVVEAKYILNASGGIPSPEIVFEEKHFMGDELSKKWSAFQQNYKRVYEQSVGFSSSTVEIVKPTIYNSVNRVNNFYKKALRKGEITESETKKTLNHLLDCANLLCFEDNTENIESEIKQAKTIEDIIRIFASIRINY